MKIATWNVNSIKARLPNVLDWLGQARPDVLLLQETKCPDEDFPRLEFESRGFNVATHGQKSYNGVAVLSTRPIVEVVRGLPGNPEDGEARHIEAVLEGGLRVASIYVPMGQSPDSDRFPFKLRFLDAVAARARDLLRAEEAFVFGGDFNVAPEPIDVYDPDRMGGRVLYHPEERRRLRRMLFAGLTDAYRALHPQPGAFTWWDYRAGAWQQGHGLRIDHLLLSPQAADRLVEAGIDKETRGKDKCSDHSPVWCELSD